MLGEIKRNLTGGWRKDGRMNPHIAKVHVIGVRPAVHRLSGANCASGATAAVRRA